MSLKRRPRRVLPDKCEIFVLFFLPSSSFSQQTPTLVQRTGVKLSLDTEVHMQACKCKQSSWWHGDNRRRGCSVNGSSWTHSMASRSQLE